jgi:hypothetical protein
MLGVLNFFADKLYLHWSLWWIDIILHFLGGICVAMFALWLVSWKSELKSWSRGKILLTTLLAALFVGILWEIYELYFGITFLSDGTRYFADTFKDLTMDLVGGFFGFLWMTHLLKKFE